MSDAPTLAERTFASLHRDADGRLQLGPEARRTLQSELTAAADGEALAHLVLDVLVLGQLLRTEGQQPAAGEAILEAVTAVNPALARLSGRRGADRGESMRRRLAGFRGDADAPRAPVFGSARTGLRPADLDPRLRLGMSPSPRARRRA